MFNSLIARIANVLFTSKKANNAQEAELAELQRKLKDREDQVLELYAVIKEKDEAYEVLFHKMRFEMKMVDEQVTLRKAVAAHHQDAEMLIWLVQGQNTTPAGTIPFVAYVSAKTEAQAIRKIAGHVPNLGSQSARAEDVTQMFAYERLEWAINPNLVCDAQQGSWNIKPH